MVNEYYVFDDNKKFIETVHMTEQEFNIYFNEHKTAAFYNKHEASSVWQK